MENITLDDIRYMVNECVGRLLESTNMKTLYHFTTVPSLKEIAKTNKLLAANCIKDYWDNNSHISLTRHRSNYEGFSSVSDARSVRIQFNVDKLNSRHNVLNIKPMEFYSPKRHGEWELLGPKPYGSAKSFYQRFHNNYDDFNNIEYRNQAEEGLQMAYKRISHGLEHLNKYIDRIDILCDFFDDACTNYKMYIHGLSDYKEISEMAFAKAVPIYVYKNKRDFVIQNNKCMTLGDMIKYFQENICDIDKEYGAKLDAFLKDCQIYENKINENEMNNIDKSFVPNPQWMQEKYDEMNAQLFRSQLGGCEFGIFTTGRGSGGNTLGRFKISGDKIKIERHNGRMFRENYYERQYINKDNFVELCRPIIELNGNYSGTEHGFLTTLVHEMCHYYTYMYGWAPKQAHGREFREIGYLVSNRSNGLFTVQRLASAEQMREFELNDEMKARKQKRLENKKASVTVIIAFRNNGHVEMTMTSNNNLINTIVSSCERKNEKVLTSNDANVIEYLFAKGFRKNMRTWRFWYIESRPWLNELKSMIEDDEDNVIHANMPVEDPPKERKMFIIKTSNGTFECNADSQEELMKTLRGKFPKMNDETLNKIINNPANYKIMENKKNTKDIIKEVLDEFITDEMKNTQGFDDTIEITPDMNLGRFSPLQL